jgi:hypothetical protein
LLVKLARGAAGFDRRAGDDRRPFDIGCAGSRLEERQRLYRHEVVGTEKRERQKANRAKRQAEEAKVARSSAVKRNVVRWIVIAIAAVAAVVVIAWIGGAFDDEEEPAPTTIPIATLPAELPVTSTDGSATTAPAATDPVATTAAP